MKLPFVFLLLTLSLLSPPVESVVMAAPRQWLRGERFNRTRRLDQNPAGAHIVDENTSPNKTFEPVGAIDLDFNPSFVVYDMFDSGPGLTVSSFHNVALNPAMLTGGGPNSTMGGPPFLPFERDLVAVITNLEEEEPVVHCLTENTTSDTVWPNQARRAPDGMFPFEAVVVPQGWFAKTTPGRLVALSVNTDEEIVIHQSSREEPRFYHSVQFVDMDQDGVLDLVTVRSGYQVGRVFRPPLGELVWFRNPGVEAMVPHGNDTSWEEFVIVDDLGPDVFLDAHDMTGNGIPEIVATHFFAGLADMDGTPWDSASRVTLYGAPEGQTWTAVNLHSSAFSAKPLVADIVGDQGMMFSVEIVDLNGDGRFDILATNHQTVQDPIDGRVLGLEPPESGRLFEDPWTVHILKHGIRPNQAPPGLPARPMAPGVAKTFQPPYGSVDRPWIALSGDEASKAWVMKATSEPWVYEEELLLDINDYYGENTTRTMQQDPFGITISTIGEIGIREEDGQVMLYVPVFEATDIHVFRSKNAVDGAVNEAGPSQDAGGSSNENKSSSSIDDQDVSGATPIKLAPTWMSAAFWALVIIVLL